MEPKPVISYFGDVEILGTVLQKKLQSRLSHLQVLTREEGSSASFSTLCSGVEFQLFKTTQEKTKLDLPLHRRPAVHTFWSGCSDIDRYRSHDRPLIKQWLDSISSIGGRGDHTPAMTLLVYCVTAEVRSKRQRPLAHLGSSSVEERLRTDYKALVDDVIVFRLASSEESRMAESFQAVVAKLNTMALTKFHRDIEAEKTAIAKQRGMRSDPEHFYTNLFLRKLHLAVTYEMTVGNEEALSMYTEATTDLEEALTLFADSASPPKWLEDMRHAPCTTWDYPKLAWTQLSWHYMAGIQTCSSPLLHTRTFLLVRVAHLLFVLERAWSVSELAISTLHCMAREIKMLNLAFPAGAFDCWAYMTCNEAIQAFMARISPDSLESATSSLLLVRAELWHYALQKLHDIGVLCGLMPSSNKLNHDKVLIKQISSGITPVPADAIDTSMFGVNDEGQKLLTMLNDRNKFQTEFLMLGEMVIGAFKHAGRRRMAFRVGTLIAQFHRDLGLVVEAEELLSDICKFYSEDQWTELSTKAYSLLADCQMKLRLEDKHVNTMLLLSSFPPYPAASHDPVQWMAQVTRIAQRSPYQKLLNWDPLLELVKVAIVDGKECYGVDDSVVLDLVIRLHGPKEMKSLIATVQTKLASSLQILSGTSSVNHTPYRAPRGPSPTVSVSSLLNLEELDLELQGKQLPHSRPIGEVNKMRGSSHVVTHISHATITEMEAGWHGGEEGNKGREVMLMARKVDLKPGENRVRLEGKATKSGEYAPHKVSLKFGSLDFVYTMPPKQAKEHIFNVQDPQINVDIALTPEEGVFLAGIPQDCMMTFMTSNDTSIPEQATVRVLASADVSIHWHNHTSRTVVNTDAGTIEHWLTLPTVPPDTSHDCHMTITLPDMKHVAMETTESHDQPEQLPVWEHMIEVYCDWLSPCYMAKLPLEVYQPLTLTCLEHSSAAQESSFLQLLLRNTCPLPLLLAQPALDTSVGLDKLHGDLPQVFFPLETFSFLWRVQPAAQVILPRTTGSFDVNFSLLPLQFDWDEDEVPSDPTFRPAHFKLVLSNMQTVFEVKCAVEPMKEQVCVLINQPSSLHYTIHNVTALPPQETHFGGMSPPATPTAEYKLGYEVCVDKKVWSVEGKGHGFVDVPGPQETRTLNFRAVPNVSGAVTVPRLLLKWVAMETGLGQESCVLSNAQVYNLCWGQMVTVQAHSS